MDSLIEMREGVELADRARSDHRGTVALALLAVGLVALAVAWLGDPRAASFSDAGGRLATTKVMADSGSWVPDLGYWAGAVDPTGNHHADPLRTAARRPVGRRQRASHWSPRGSRSGSSEAHEQRCCSRS